MRLLTYHPGRGRSFVLALLVLFSFCAAAAVALTVPRRSTRAVSCTPELTVKEAAAVLGASPKGLARELGLPVDISKRRTLAFYGVEQSRLDEVARHLASHRPVSGKYFVYAGLVAFGLFFLLSFGRPVGGVTGDRREWYPRFTRVLVLSSSVIVCGFLLGKSPNPMEGVVKLFKALAGLYPSVPPKLAAFLFFILLAILGNKMICGWACPFGSLQDLCHSIPLPAGIKRRKVSFLLSNAVRALLFAVFVLMLFGFVGPGKGYVLYHGINPFNLFELHVDGAAMIAVIVLSLGLGVLLYRPFCHFACPFGFVSWLAERVSLCRVVLDRDKCTGCGACARACPSNAAAERLEGRLLPADCFSCADCLRSCPADAIDYECRLS